MGTGTAPLEELDFARAETATTGLIARQVVEWAADRFGDSLVMSTSFGIQSAVMLHLVTQVRPSIPVIWVDTGYLPAETYRFAERLTERLQLNLHVAQAEMTPARMESLHGRLWESRDLSELDRYDRIRKVEPLQRALRQLNVKAWLSGLRRQQTQFRRTLSHVMVDGYRYKVLPILDWTSRDVYEYLERHDLPYHPLFEQGYVTVGDWHSSRPRDDDDLDDRDTRFGGMKQECGIHLPENTSEHAASAAA